jgi:hypothetical protein
MEIAVSFQDITTKLLMSYALCPVFMVLPILYLDDLLIPLQIVNNPLVLPEHMTPELKNLLEGLLCKGW